MKLINRQYKDYYDGVLTSLYQDDLLFDCKNRTTYMKRDDVYKSHLRSNTIYSWYFNKEKEFDMFNNCDLNESWPFGSHVSMFSNLKEKNEKTLYYLCFCGKMYPFIREYNFETKTYKIYYSDDNIDKIKKSLSNPPKKYSDCWVKMMEENRSPIFLVNMEEFSIEWNPNLKNLGFYKILDQYQAAQQIFQFFSNLGNIENKIPHIDNDTMIEIHGFNKKESFRNMKRSS